MRAAVDVKSSLQLFGPTDAIDGILLPVCFAPIPDVTVAAAASRKLPSVQVALLACQSAAEMQFALGLMQEWAKTYGPNAIRFEIAFDGLGYVLAISQQLDLIRWRLAGLETAR